MRTFLRYWLPVVLWAGLITLLSTGEFNANLTLRVLRAVAAGGPAARGGLRKGDIVRSVNGTRVDTAGQYRALLAALKPGDAAVLKAVRERKDVELRLTAGERP